MNRMDTSHRRLLKRELCDVRAQDQRQDTVTQQKKPNTISISKVKRPSGTLRMWKRWLLRQDTLEQTQPANPTPPKPRSRQRTRIFTKKVGEKP